VPFVRFDPQSNFMPEFDEDGAVVETPDSEAAESAAGRLRVHTVATLLLVTSAALGAMWWMTQRGPRAATAEQEARGDLATRRAAASETTRADRDALTSALEASADAGDGESAIGPSDGAGATGAGADRWYAAPAAAAEGRSAYRRGVRLLGMGRCRDAAAALERAVELDPASAEAHYRLGLAYVRLGATDAARRERATLRALDPNLANLLGNLVR
jgi:Flp pilus assembly protein TadD